MVLVEFGEVRWMYVADKRWEDPELELDCGFQLIIDEQIWFGNRCLEATREVFRQARRESILFV